VSVLYCLLNSEVRAEIVRKWRLYKHKREQPKRDSAHSLPVGHNSVLSAFRMYSGGCPGVESLTSASGVVVQEVFGPDFLSPSKFSHEQHDDANQGLSLFQEIELQSYYHDDNVHLNQNQHNQTTNGFFLPAQISSERNQATRNVDSNPDTEDSTSN